MVKAAWYASIMILMLFGSFAAYRGDIAETIWFCSCIHLGIIFSKEDTK